ncbi:efflux RND transporter permease subunit [Caulobacter segnis]
MSPRWTALIIGAILAVLVVLLFLRDWRATLMAAVAMPDVAVARPSPCMAPDGLQSLNGVTLLALSLTVGILVDDAIVEIENIRPPHARRRKPLRGGHGGGRRRSAWPVVATTFTIVAVFAPVGFMPGITRPVLQGASPWRRRASRCCSRWWSPAC